MKRLSMIRTLLVCAFSVFSFVAIAANGDSERNAVLISSGGSKSISLVNEYDTEWEETTGAACYYFKVTLKRGGEYTFWTSDFSSKQGGTGVTIDIYPKSEDCTVWAVGETMFDGINSRAYISSEDWYEEDPASGTFYICVSGDNIGDEVTIHFSGGNIPDASAVDGSAAAPVLITPKEKENGKEQVKTGATLGEGMPDPAYFYYRTGNVEVGRAYYFTLMPTKWSSDANATNDVLNLQVSSYSEDMSGEFRIYDLTTDVDLANGATRVKVVPEDTTPLLLEISSGEYGTEFELSYSIAPKRLPEDHANLKEMGALTTDAFRDVASPKLRRWPLDSQYADQVIDQQLYSFSVTKGKSYALGVEGLNLPTNIVVEVYDAQGRVLYSDRTGDPSQNFAALVAFEATADAVYYLGVAQDIDDGVIETLTAAEVIDFNCTVFAQEIARVVDTHETAEPLAFDIAGERTSMEHALTLVDWSDYFAFTPTRKDITYNMKAVPAEGALNADLPVVGTLYTLNAQGALVEVANYKNVDLRTGLSFTATTISQTAPVAYYLEVKLDGASGHAFGSYTVNTSMTSAKGGGVGALQVYLLGGDGQGTWSLQGDESSLRKRPSGEVAVLPAGDYKLAFATVQGWSSPTNRTVTVAAGEVTSLTLNYNDTFDPKDDSPKTTTSKLTLKTGVNTFGRSLFGGADLDGSDDVDWFSFTVSKDNTYRYDVWPSDDALEARLYTADKSFNMTEYVCERPTDNGFNFQPLPKGTYYIAVTRRAGFETFTGVYELYIVAYDLGSVKLDKASYTVKEDAGVVTFKISRTGTSEAAVYFSTQALTATPGEDYVPVVSNIVEWAEGDKSTKTITVPILPDLVSKWESNKTFRVYLHPYVDEWQEEMFGYTNTQPDILDPSSAVVTITETAKIAPGKIGFIGYDRNDEAGVQPFADPKKATVVVAAGDTFKLWVGRGTATDGRVGVKLETKDGTAKSVNAKNPEAVDFSADWFTTTKSGNTAKLNTSTNLYWEAGVDDGQCVTIRTTANETNFTERTFTVKLTVDAQAGQKATLDTTSTVTVTIRNPNVGQTAEELIAALGKTPAVKVAATPKGAWFNATDGTFRSVPVTAKTKPSLTLTVTGPGVMKFRPSLSKGADTVDFTCAYGKSKWTYVSDGEVTLYLGKGNQTLKFALAPKKNVTLIDADDVYAAFANDYDGTFHSWTPLAPATNPLPSDKQGLVSVTAKPNTTTLSWEGATGANIGYAVTIADSQQNITKNPATNAVVRECAFDLQDWDPGKQCHWRVDTLWLEGDEVKLAATNGVWTFKTAQDAAATTVQMMGTDGVGMGVPYNSGETVRLIQGLKTSFALGTSANIVEGKDKLTFKTVGGKLPTGLTLKNDTVTGVPTAEGTFTAVFQATAGKAAATTTALTFVVEPMGVAVGTFNGLIKAEDAGLSVYSQRLGSMAVTVTKQGKVTAKAKVGATTYSFSGTGFDKINVDVNGVTNLQARLVATQKSGKTTVTNACLVSVPMGAVDDAVALTTAATCQMTLLEGDADECRYNSNSVCGLLRDSRKEALHFEGIAGYVGYYTVALPQPLPESAAIGLGGAGYLTVTIDAKGGAKVAGMKGDGTTLSVSGVPGLASDGSLLIPLFTSAKTTALGGCLRLAKTAGGGIVADAMETFLWLEDDPNKTYEGETGFAQELAPTGGLYDQLSNLQRYYLDRVLTFNTGSFGDDLELMKDEVYPAGLDWLSLCPGRAEGKCFDEFGFTFLGNTVSVAKKSLVKREENNKLYWFDESENPANVSMKFTRATGVFSGAFSLWFADAWDQCDQTTQKEVTGAKYNGVFLTSREDLSDGEIAADYVALGAVTFPVNVKYTVLQGNREVTKTRKWTGSWLFSIDAEDISEDNQDLWNSEAEVAE